jgi:non-heme chloroperoxidase
LVLKHNNSLEVVELYYVTVEPNVKIAVYDVNPCGKQTVFFIHGWPINHNMFEYQMNVLPKLGFRCISIDLRGFGKSDVPWNGYSYDRLADDIYQVIRTINVSTMTLAGFSMGGPIAIKYMTRHNGFKICKLALFAAAAPSFTKREGYPYGMTVASVNELIARIYKDRPQAVADFGTNFFAKKNSANFTDWFNIMAYSASGYSTIKTAESLRDSDLRDCLPQIHVPTAIFHGALDKICPFEFALEMNRGIPNSQLYRFEQSGHGLFYDEMDLFNNRLAEFINS